MPLCNPHKFPQEFPLWIYRLFMIFVFLQFSTESFAQSTIEVIPASPKSRETVRLKVSKFDTRSHYRDGVFMTGNKIVVKLIQNDLPLPVPVTFLTQVVLGQLPAGTFDIEVREVTTAGYQSSAGDLLISTQITVSDENIGRSTNLPRYNYTDLWWDSNQPGWGMNIMVKNDQFFATWFVYDAAGRAAWYTFQGGNWVGNQCYGGPIQKVSGPPWGGILGLSGGLSSVVVSQAGTGIICYSSYNSAGISYTVEGMTQNKMMSRQPF